ncbi:MAG: PAS domain-containing protein, partial [Solirubrobacterales bacterium]|nr:PAS domain-containing protein [Solirubrobacterales bacterium]
GMVMRETSGAVLPDDAVPAALDALPFGAVVLDELERVVYANRTAHRIVHGMQIGARAQWAAVPQPTSEDRRADDEHGAGQNQAWIATLSGGLGGRVRAMRIAVEGLDRQTLIMLSPLPDSDDRGEEPAQRLEEVEAVSRVGSWNWEIEADVVTWSDELFRLNGLLPQAVPVNYERVARHYHPDDRAAHVALVERCRRTGEPFESIHRVVRPDGTVRWRHGRGSAVMVDGRAVRMYGTVQDITRRVEREQALQHSLEESQRLAAENEELRGALEAQVLEVRASRARIVQAGDEARRLMERDLHDGAQQRLTTLGLILRSAQAQARAAAGARPAVLRALEDALEALKAGLSELRTLARGLHPAILTDEGLLPALEALVTRSSTPVNLSAMPIGRLPTPVETTAYLFVSEGLANAVRHAGASSVAVEVERQEGTLFVTVSDDGAGGATIGRAGGLEVLSDRVAALDGHLELDSPPGEGTRLRAELPCA